MSEYMSAVEAAAKWGITTRRVTVFCGTDRIAGAFLVGNSWAIPANAEKPPDARIKSGQYIGAKRSQKAKPKPRGKDGEGR